MKVIVFGCIIGVIKGETRYLDSGSYGEPCTSRQERFLYQQGRLLLVRGDQILNSQPSSPVPKNPRIHYPTIGPKRQHRDARSRSVKSSCKVESRSSGSLYEGALIGLFKGKASSYSSYHVAEEQRAVRKIPERCRGR